MIRNQSENESNNGVIQDNWIECQRYLVKKISVRKYVLRFGRNRNRYPRFI